jgi:hypothetical protein
MTTANSICLFCRLDTSTAVQSTYKSSFNANHETMSRDDCGTSKYYYEALQTTVSVNASIMFCSNSNLDTFAFFYQHKFDPFDLSSDLMASDDDGCGNSQFRLCVDLRPNANYTLVVTTNTTRTQGAFSVAVFGGAEITFTRMDHISEYDCH